MRTQQSAESTLGFAYTSIVQAPRKSKGQDAQGQEHELASVHTDDADEPRDGTGEGDDCARPGQLWPVGDGQLVDGAWHGGGWEGSTP